jgi:hypothetical protein
MGVFFTKYWQQLVEKEKHVLIGAITQHQISCCGNCIPDMHRSCDRVMPLAKASENAKTSFLFHDISDGMKYVQLTLKNVVQNRQ